MPSGTCSRRVTVARALRSRPVACVTRSIFASATRDASRCLALPRRAQAYPARHDRSADLRCCQARQALPAADELAPAVHGGFQLAHDPEKWIPVFGKDHATPIN